MRGMNGEKSDVGIVTKKLARKAAKVSESAFFFIADASTDPKGRDLCEARNRGRRVIEGSHVPDRSRGVMKCEEPGNEHKEKPSGASTGSEAEIAERLQTVKLGGKENEHGGTGAGQ